MTKSTGRSERSGQAAVPVPPDVSGRLARLDASYEIKLESVWSPGPAWSLRWRVDMERRGQRGDTPPIVIKTESAVDAIGGALDEAESHGH